MKPTTPQLERSTSTRRRKAVQGNSRMKFCMIMLLAGGVLGANARQVSDPGNLSLHYDGPAKDWASEGLPIGNGQLGAMLFGGVEMERIQFNEESLWIGNEEDTGAYQNFGEVLMMFGSGGPIVTNPSNHASSALAGWVTTCAPVDRLAMNLAMASEISEPPKPRMAANTNRPPISWPVLARY